MRKPDRIHRIIELLAVYWQENPDMRLAQIIGDCHGARDPYHMEDDRIERFLNQLPPIP